MVLLQQKAQGVCGLFTARVLLQVVWPIGAVTLSTDLNTSGGMVWGVTAPEERKY